MPTINRKFKKKKRIKQTNNTINFAMFYNSKGWKHLRQSYITHHPLCEECLLKGIVTPAEHVHHKIPFSTGSTEEEQWELLLDPNNLQSLCRECHSLKHPNKFTKINK